MNAADWTQDIVELYESGAVSQFILHGNVSDRLLIPTKEGLRSGSLEEYLHEALLGRFDVLLSYDLGNGLRLEKGGEVFKQWPSLSDRALPRAPREAVETVTHYLRFVANVARMPGGQRVRVAVIMRAAELVAPPLGGGLSYDLNAVALLIRDWASDPLITQHHAATFLLTENLNDLHPLISQNARAARVSVPLPDARAMERILVTLEKQYPAPLQPWKEKLTEPAAALAGATMHSVERLLQTQAHQKKELRPEDLALLKKELIERDCEGLIEFIKPERTLADIHGQEAVKEWIRQDIKLWQTGDLAALPMGYLFCGPVGTGKTFLVECVAGEAGVPVVKLKNFRDRWVGSTEGNLEKIFRLLGALGRCMVFVDEADQALGRRNAESGDSGVGGRVYSMMAEQMSNTRLRGRVMWVLATSRPDLIEVDLKRPGRIDLKIPLFPTANPEEGYALIRALCKKRGLTPNAILPEAWRSAIPDLLTPGAAEALAVKAYRLHKTEALAADEALQKALQNYQAPVAPSILKRQIALAVAEATDLSFVPERFREMAAE